MEWIRLTFSIDFFLSIYCTISFGKQSKLFSSPVNGIVLMIFDGKIETDNSKWFQVYWAVSCWLCGHYLLSKVALIVDLSCFQFKCLYYLLHKVLSITVVHNSHIYELNVSVYTICAQWLWTKNTAVSCLNKQHLILNSSFVFCCSLTFYLGIISTVVYMIKLWTALLFIEITSIQFDCRWPLLCN